MITPIEAPAGCRAETEQAYLRILSQNVLDFAKNGGTGGSGAGAAATEGCLDLSGSGREFLTRELATSLLEAMQKPGMFRFPTLHEVPANRVVR